MGAAGGSPPVGGAAGVPGPAIIPVGYEAVSGFSADERSASATFV